MQFMSMSGEGQVDKKYENIDGTPYTFLDYLQGYVLDRRGAKTEGYLLLDGYSNKLIFYSDDQEKIQLISDKYPIFVVNNTEGGTLPKGEIQFINGISSSDFSRDTYLRVAYEGNSKMYIWDKVSLLEPTSSGSYGSARDNRAFKYEPKEYVQLSNGTLIPFERKAKWFKKNMGATGAKAKQYISDENLNLKYDTDLVKLLTYLDSL
jgi:hypothetical protein